MRVLSSVCLLQILVFYTLLVSMKCLSIFSVGTIWIPDVLSHLFSSLLKPEQLWLEDEFLNKHLYIFLLKHAYSEYQICFDSTRTEHSKNCSSKNNFSNLLLPQIYYSPSNEMKAASTNFSDVEKPHATSLVPSWPKLLNIWMDSQKHCWS